MSEGRLRLPYNDRPMCRPRDTRTTSAPRTPGKASEHCTHEKSRVPKCYGKARSSAEISIATRVRAARPSWRWCRPPTSGNAISCLWRVVRAANLQARVEEILMRVRGQTCTPIGG